MSKTKTNLMYALATNLAKYGKPETPKGAKHVHLTKKQNKEKEKYVKDLKKSLTEESANYMFFQNLKTIKDAIDEILKLDEKAVDNILSKGHDWASDHIATAKDDIEEVKDFLVNKNVVINENKIKSIVTSSLLKLIENTSNKLTLKQEIAVQFANYLNQSNSLDNNEFGFNQFKKSNATIANIGNVEYEDIKNLIKKINNKYTLTVENIYFENQQLNENFITDKLTEYWNKLKSTLDKEESEKIEKKVNSMTEQQKIETINNIIKKLETNNLNKFLIEFWNKFKSKINSSVLNVITLLIVSSAFLQSCEVQKYYTSDKVNTRDAYYNKPGDKRPSTRYNPKRHKHYRIKWGQFPQLGGGDVRPVYYW